MLACHTSNEDYNTCKKLTLELEIVIDKFSSRVKIYCMIQIVFFETISILQNEMALH